MERKKYSEFSGTHSPSFIQFQFKNHFRNLMKGEYCYSVFISAVFVKKTYAVLAWIS